MVLILYKFNKLINKPVIYGSVYSLKEKHGNGNCAQHMILDLKDSCLRTTESRSYNEGEAFLILLQFNLIYACQMRFYKTEKRIVMPYNNKKNSPGRKCLNEKFL